jgi:hypothetical protein
VYIFRYADRPGPLPLRERALYGLGDDLGDLELPLPPEFVADTRVTNRSAGGARHANWSTVTADDSHWIDWARSYRVSAVENLLQEARASASRICEEMLAAAAEEQTARLGLRTGSCVTASCGRQALLGKAFCGRCLAERDRARLEVDAEAAEIRRII